ncbi:hypothetical protein SAMN05421866_0024 [Chryseobacterium oranimense]|uniref:Uncharacterized protein n=1 Tax=Chryseobacterium oranimense TaxID=421058 RepID=A0A1M5X822_9FLAO|nr:hypothetical protein [Chryseobacterium oranimense]SHH95718.1 hypothetical protein SAMN05421866_0024 [Chryseobacterium oranimense]
METKVQKNLEEKNNQDLKTVYSAIELLKQEQFKTAILKIISDEVMNYRIDDAITKLHNCFAPFLRKDADWDGVNKRNGYTVALHILGIADDDELCEKLFTTLYEHGYNSLFDAELVANVIFQNWVYEITNHINSKN